MRLVPIFPNGDDPGFNHQAAADAYAWAMEHPQEAVTVAKSMGFDEFVTLVDRNREPIQKMVDEFVYNRAELLKSALKRQVISKAARNEDISALMAAGEAISKAGRARDENELRRQAERQWRGPGGRFRTMNIKIARTEEQGAYTTTKVPPAAANRLGIPMDDRLTGDQKAKFHNAWLQVADALGSVKGLDPGDVTVAYKYRDQNGKPVGIETSTGTDPSAINLDRFNRDEELDEVEIIVDPTMSAAGASFDLLAGIIGPSAAGTAQQTVSGFAAAAPTFANEWNKGLPKEMGTRTEDYQRIGAASRLIQSTFGDQIGPAGRIATALGNWVGTQGPEAEKVLGPGTRKLSYRYRGVEKRPDPELQQDVDRVMNQVTGELRRAGAKEESSRNAARDFLIYGAKSHYGSMDFGKMRPRSKDEVRESPLVTRMSALLPSMELTQLQLASGHVPPSHGIIIDRRGVITTQAVGYGDDWYLPFNLKTIGQVNGGEYVRTRTLGGPTSEDFYTAMITEARAFTVVSHSGVFTVEFDKTFRGTRRFNDKAKRMVDRYEKLLDAVKSQQVTPLVPQDRMAELRQRVIDDGYSDPGEQREALKRLIDKEKQSPQMSKQAELAARDQWLSDFYGPNFTEPTGKGLDMEGLKQYYVSKRVKDLAKEDRKPAPQTEFDWDAAAADLAGDQRSGESFEGAADLLAANDANTPLFGENMSAREKYAVAAAGVKNQRSREQLESIAAAEFDADPIESLARYDSKIEERWNTALTGIKYNYARDNAAMSLDAQGYFNAMKALQEQFPYYIKKVDYRALPGQESYTGAADSGYVMPRYNRPTQAQAGYYDRAVLGQGKKSAAETGYQNYRVRQGVSLRAVREGRSDDPVEASGGLGGGSVGERKKRLKEINAKTDAGWNLYRHLTTSGRHWVYHPDLAPDAKGNRKASVNFTDPQWRENLENLGLQAPVLFGDVERIAGLIPGYNGPQSRSQLKINDGKEPTGPFSQEEFAEMADRVPGFLKLVEEQALAAVDKFRSESSADISSVRNDLIDVLRNGPGGGDEAEVWTGSGLPDNVLKFPGRVFSFPEQAYKPNQPSKVYEDEAESVYGRVQRRASAVGQSLPGWPKGDPLRFVGKEQLDSAIQEATDKVDMGDVEERVLLLKELHKIRRLQRLWGSDRKAEAERDAMDEGLRRMLNEGEAKRPENA